MACPYEEIFHSFVALAPPPHFCPFPFQIRHVIFI